MIAYFNAGAESEHLSKWADAKSHYEMALRLVQLNGEQAKIQMESKIIKAL